MDTERWYHPQAFDNWIHTDNNMEFLEYSIFFD